MDDAAKMNFQHWEIAKDTYAIQCPGYLPGPGRLPGWGHVICYLLVGKEKALLQDTGFGNADLKQYVEQITDKPLVVVNSHIHPDHSGGNSQFEEIYVLEEETDSDAPVYFSQTGDKAPCAAVKSAGDYRFKRVPEGTVLDLGDRLVEMIRLEGHTKGSMVLLDHKTRFLFSGDAILKRVLLLGGLPLSTYRAALLKVAAYEFEDIYSSHWYEPLGKDYIQKMVALIDDFDPERCESAPWTDLAGLEMFCHGSAFEESDFCAIGFGTDAWELMKR